MAKMQVFMNFNEVRGPYGGTNSFLRTLWHWLGQQGAEVTNKVDSSFDVALLSGLTDGVELSSVKAIAARGVPIVHRKVGYRVSGSQEMRRMTDGVVWGDKLQIEFTPYISHTVFQSEYSRDVFQNSGFDGPFSVIHNGVDEAIFNTKVSTGWFGRRETTREWWNGSDPLRVIISTWSADKNKGFDDYIEIDRLLANQRDVQVTLVGRTPTDTLFRHIKVRRARPRARLARLLKHAHIILQLGRFETCSNALIEGLNCGLPAIYLDSGSNKEIAATYGVPYVDGWPKALEIMQARYREFLGRIDNNPYRISVVGPKYLKLLRNVLESRS